MKFTRLVLGSAIVIAALWLIIGEQISGVSSNAVVNARLVTLRAPVAGTLDFDGNALRLPGASRRLPDEHAAAGEGDRTP